MTKGVKRDDSPVLQKILERLLSIDPPVKRIDVEPPDPAMAIYLLDLAEVRYITTRADAGREETALVTAGGKIFYTTLGLGEVVKKLAEHPHFLQTSKFYIVNMTKIRGIKVTNARDLWFDGIEAPVKNAVTSTYLAEFEKRLS
jgi:DNA-binding LytR/AlgR family response regulator